MLKPLEPHELRDRCDLAGEARVLTVRPDPSGPALARLEFTRIDKGRVEIVGSELPGIAIVESDRPRVPSPPENGRVQQIRRGGSRIPIVRLIRRPPVSEELPKLGTAPSVIFNAGTSVFVYLTWMADKERYVPSWWNAVTVLDPRPPL